MEHQKFHIFIAWLFFLMLMMLCGWFGVEKKFLLSKEYAKVVRWINLKSISLLKPTSRFSSLAENILFCLFNRIFLVFHQQFTLYSVLRNACMLACCMWVFRGKKYMMRWRWNGKLTSRGIFFCVNMMME